MKQHQDHSAKGLFDASQPVCLLFPFVKRHYHGMPRQNYVSVAQERSDHKQISELGNFLVNVPKKMMLLVNGDESVFAASEVCCICICAWENYSCWGKTTKKCKERAREMEREISRCLKCFSWRAAGVLCGSSTQIQNTLLLLEEVPCFT